MQVRWYYQNQSNVIGPVSVAELRYLINVGSLDMSTLVRRGDDGPWLAAERFTGLLGTNGEAENAAVPAREAPEWHFKLEGQSTQGPVLWSVLEHLMVAGRLHADDLVWKPGMAMWMPASKVRRMLDDPVPPVVREARFRERFDAMIRSRVFWAGAAMLVLLGLVLVGWVRTKSIDQPGGGALSARDVTENDGRLKGGHVDVEQWLDDARTAVRLERLDQALPLLDRYLASPLAVQAEAAKLLLREIKLATSVSEAAGIAAALGDDTLKSHLRDGVQTLVSVIRTAELRAIYERTLLQAFRHENNLRQVVPKDGFAQNSSPVDSGHRAENQNEPAQRAPQVNPDPDEVFPRPAKGLEPIAVDLGVVLDQPDAFLGKTLNLNGLFKVGTKISEVKGLDRQVLGWSLPVARNDDSTVFAADRPVEKRDVVMLLDDRLATFLKGVFKKLGLKTTIKPSFKCILTATVRRVLVNGAPTPVVLISSLEILGGCDYLSVARHQYSRSFRTLTVTADDANVDFGDGDLWVDRLGGEENFVQPIRRKFREMQRRAITNRDSAVIDAILRRELANVVSTATAINHIVAMEGFRRMRILP